MKIAFTGTREGMSYHQKHAFAKWLDDRAFMRSDNVQFHHGCCVGADTHAVTAVAEQLKGIAVYIVGHPPDRDAWISEPACKLSDELRSPRPYLERNRVIVDACEVLVACPKGPEELRSGTWSTVRYARRQGKKIVVIWPNGEVTEEGSAK
jgi:predicted Rossmann fold nucleotide-binding protein DprA/Smf involved in DNA uptake